MIQVEITNDTLTLRLNSIKDKVSNFRDFLQKSGDYMVQSIRANFDAGGRPEKWQPLLATRPPSFLKDSGRLYSSISILRMTDNSVIIGSNDGSVNTRGELKSEVMQYGTKFAYTEEEIDEMWRYLEYKGRLGEYEPPAWAEEGHIVVPPRPFIMFQDGGTEDDIGVIVNLLERHLKA